MPNALHLPVSFHREHPSVRNVNDIVEEHLTLGQRASDRVAALVGSWPFIIVQSVLLVFWVILNVTAWVERWDPYPFILMNLFLSLQAAYTAPVIMMSQNRQAMKDRIEAHNDFLVNQKAEEEVRAVLDHLAAQHDAMLEVERHLATLVESLGGTAARPKPPA